MKPWVTLTIVCWTLVCLLLSLSQQAGLNHPLQVTGLSQWLDRCREPASDSPAASVVGSTQFDPARAGPLTSLVVDGAWTAGNIGPPGQENRGPPEPIRICRLPVKARSSKQLRATLPQEIIDSTDRILRIGVLQQPLANLPFRSCCLDCTIYNCAAVDGSSSASLS
jgi:hypothetical protein